MTGPLMFVAFGPRGRVETALSIEIVLLRNASAGSSLSNSTVIRVEHINIQPINQIIARAEHVIKANLLRRHAEIHTVFVKFRIVVRLAVQPFRKRQCALNNA